MLSNEKVSLTKAEVIHSLALLHTSHEVCNDAKGTFKRYKRDLGDRFLSDFLAAEKAAKEASVLAYSLSHEMEYKASFFYEEYLAESEHEYREKEKGLRRERELFKVEAGFYSRTGDMVRRWKERDAQGEVR